MEHLLAIAAHNTLIALALAACVLMLTRLWRNPPVAHALWLLVLLRLIAPPIVHLACPLPLLPEAPPLRTASFMIVDVAPTAADDLELHCTSVDPPAAFLPADTTTPIRPSLRPGLPASAANVKQQVEAFLLFVWLGGALVCGLVACARIIRFERLLRGTLPASRRLRRLAGEIASRLGLRRAPDVRCVECVDVPFLWCAGGRPTIVLPTRMLHGLDDQRASLILAHELAHLGRRDYWVRALELVVASVYWWNPLVRLIRRHLHQIEDLCCDAWVRRSFPEWTQRYAEVVLETAESLTASQVNASPLPASPFLSSLSLKARIEMLLESRFAPSASRKSLCLVAALGLLVVPTFIQTSPVAARAQAGEDPPAAGSRSTEQPAPSEFSHAVRFEQGATRFANGDSIAISEVRGTADSFAPGNIYAIKGTYRLASRDRATLLASITATERGQGAGPTLKTQSVEVGRGEGTFTLLLPMLHRGLPHVSFYPADGGEGFGGNYFGTGESVLKRWWGSKETDRDITAATTRHDSGTAAVRDAGALAGLFKFRVPFEIGRTQTQEGGRIEIREVLGTRPQIEVGGQYLVRGRFTLPKGERGKIYFYATASGPWGQTASLDLQSTAVEGPEGEFALVHGMAGPGYFHLVLTDPERYSRQFANVYFGTGDNVYREQP